MNSEVVNEFKLVLPAREVKPGQALSLIAPLINVREFVVNFNDLTSKFEKGQKLRVCVSIYPSSRKFKIKWIKTTPFSQFLKDNCGVEKGIARHDDKFVGEIKKTKLFEIAKQRVMTDKVNLLINKSWISKIKSENLDLLIKKEMLMLENTARSMGVVVVE